MGFIKFDQKYESPCNWVYWLVVVCCTILIVIVGQVVPSQFPEAKQIEMILCMPAVDYIKFMVFFILAYTVYLDMSGESSKCSTSDWTTWASVWLLCLICTGIMIFGCTRAGKGNLLLYGVVVYLCSSTMSCTKNMLENDKGMLDGGFWKDIGNTLNPANWF
jgi:hypothetical protein